MPRSPISVPPAKAGVPLIPASCHRRVAKTVFHKLISRTASYIALTILWTACQHAPARAEPITVTAAPVSSFQNLSTNTEFGPFSWRGGLSLTSPETKFGGLSGLALSGNCESLLAISDAGRWFEAKLTYADGKLSRLTDGGLSPMLDSKGRPQRGKVWGDAEAMAVTSPGTIAVAYESRVRFGTYDIGAKGFASPFQPMPYPKDIDRGPDNGEVEALGVLPSGRFIAIAERNRDAQGNIRGWLWKGKSPEAFFVSRYGGYNITDLTVLADGTVLTLERSFSTTTLPGMAIRRFQSSEATRNAVIAPELILEARVPFFAIDNMEGIAACERGGETRITVMSDNNFNTSLQRTLLLQFAYKP